MRIYRASALGGCMKAQIAEQLGYKRLEHASVDESLSHEGNLHEEDIANKLLLEDRQLEVNLELTPSITVQGHIDGKAKGVANTYFIAEIKSMGDSTFKVWNEKRWDAPGLVQKYKWQVSVYMHATGLPCEFVVKNRNTGKVITVYVTEPFYTKEEILARVLEMEKWVRKDELPETCDVNNYPCPFYYLEEQLTLEVTEDGAIDQLAEAYNQASKEVRAAENKKKEMRKALDAGLAGRERVITDHCRVVYYETKREVLDEGKMREAGIDVDEFKVQKIFKNLRVTVKEPDERRGTDEPGGDGGGEAPDPATVGDVRQGGSPSDVHEEPSAAGGL